MPRTNKSATRARRIDKGTYTQSACDLNYNYCAGLEYQLVQYVTTYSYRQIDSRTNRQTSRKIYRQTGRKIYRQTDGEMDRWTDGQIDSFTDRQTERQIYRGKSYINLPAYTINFQKCVFYSPLFQILSFSFCQTKT